MSDAIIQVAKYIRDLLSKTEEVVKIGRSNVNQDNFTNEFIVIDSIAPQTLISSNNSFSNNNINIVNRFKIPLSIRFYGDNALTNANLFLGLSTHQKGTELSIDYGVEIYRMSSLLDLSNLLGSQYYNLYEITLNCKYNYMATISTDAINYNDIEFTFIKNY